MELDQLKVNEVLLAAEVIKVMGDSDDIEQTGQRITILEAVLYTYRRKMRELNGNA